MSVVKGVMLMADLRPWLVGLADSTPEDGDASPQLVVKQRCTCSKVACDGPVRLWLLENQLMHFEEAVVVMSDLRGWLSGLADYAVEGGETEADWPVRLAVLALLG